MKKINHYDVRILKDGTKKFEVENIEILASNNEYTVLNDHYYTKLNNTSNRYCEHKIGVSHVSEWKTGYPSLDGIRYTLYTYKTRKSATIRNEIQKYINEHYSFLFEVDLSFIK